MTKSPSDEWLMALVDEKSPEELTVAELSALRARMSASPEIRQAIAERLRLEEGLHSVVADPPVSAGAIRRRITRRRLRRLTIGTVGAVLLIMAIVPGLWWLAIRQAATPKSSEGVSRITNRESIEPANQLPQVAPQAGIEPVEAARPQPSVIASPTVSTAPTDASQTKEVADVNWWESMIGDEAVVVPFTDSVTARFGETIPGFEVADEFPAAELKRWLSAVPEHAFNINEGRWRGKRFAGLEGVGKLLPAWRDDTVLRIAPFDVGEFALHFWSGANGVSIRFYPHQRPKLLAAYAVTRTGDELSPKTFRLISTDGSRYARSNAGALEVRHQREGLVVTRGALPLLVVPGVDRPSEVLLEGKMRLRTLAMYRGAPAVLSEKTPHRNLFDDKPVGELDWIESKEPAAKLEKTTGQVTLSWTKPKPDGEIKAAWAAIAFPQGAPSGLCEAVFRIDSLTPGTGMYLGDAAGQPIHTVFASENRTVGSSVLAFGWSSRNGKVPEPRWEWNVDPGRELVPAVGTGSWIKLVVGAGGLKTYISGDGVHWGPAARAPERNTRGPIASIGLFAIADDQPRKITVSVAAVRELSALLKLADDELRHRVPDFGNDPPERMADWLAWVTATQPVNVPENEWLRACGVETLARGSSDAIAEAVLDGMARAVIESDRSVAETIAILHDAALVSDQWNEKAKAFAGYYQQLARRIARGSTAPVETALDSQTVIEGSLAAPIWAESSSGAVPPAAIENIAAAAWAATTDPASAAKVRSAARYVAASFLPAHPESGWSTEEEAGLARLAAWSGQFMDTNATSARTVTGFDRRHPLVTEPGREAQTLASELDAALAAEAYTDAARLLSAIAEVSGLVPAVSDSNRFVPPVGLITEVAARHPKLIATLAEQFGPAGVLHVRQSIASGDEDAVQAGAIRYFGTPAASEARRWLGERDLAAGRFDEAENHFASALVAAPEPVKATLMAYQRLAGALAGNAPSDMPTDSVTIGSRTLSAEEFEQLLDDLLQTRAITNELHHAAEQEIPQAVAVSPQARGRFEGDVGRNPGRHEHRRFDWAGRQISVTLHGNTAYLTNRFQIVAFDLARKSPAWSVGLGNEQGEAHALPNVPFRPIVDVDRLYARRLLARGPELACLSLTDRGKVVWRSESHLAFASDPVLDAERLIAVTCASTARSGGPFTLALTRLRKDDGSEVTSTPLVVLNAAGDEKPSAQLVSTGDGFLVTTAGTILRCDGTGNLVWIRRLPYLPASANVYVNQSPPVPPLLLNNRIIFAPPGSRTVVCLEATTGRLLWTRPTGELVRLVGLSGGLLIAHMKNGMSGLDPATGNMMWHYFHESLLDGVLADANLVMVPARTALENRRDGLSLLRIDSQTGRLLSEQVVRIDRNEEIRCGPLFVYDEAVWAFLGDGWRDPNRTLVEFIPNNELPAVEPASHPGSLRNWLSYVEPQTRFNVAAVLPGWTMTGSQSGKGATFHDEHRGQRWVMLTQAGRDRAARFVRRVEIKPGQELTARIGRDDDAGWTLRLLADGKPLASEPVNSQTAPDGWRTAVFDLSPLAGREVLLALDQAPPAADANRTTKAYWKQVSIE